MIPFNKPYLHGRELVYIANAVASGKISGDGVFSKKCQSFFEEKYFFKKTLMTTSCTDALEMCAILLDIGLNDEVIVPSFTFVSTANAFALRGAKIIFADSGASNPNIDHNKLEELITLKTKAIVVVHYAGISCDMDSIMNIANKYNIPVIEDAAQAIDSFYKGQPLGGIGDMAAFSFHETKNIISGEGGLLVINNKKYIERAEIIREKGTNRASFFRGEVNKYGWMDIGSSFLPSDIISAYLYAQLENMDEIQRKRKKIWECYHSRLRDLKKDFSVDVPYIPEFATNNAHMFYLICNSLEQRTYLIEELKKVGVHAVFHYISLHSSEYIAKNNICAQKLTNSDRYTNCLVRLPMFYEMSIADVEYVSGCIIEILENYKK